MKNDFVIKYFKILKNKRKYFILKRIFDILISLILILFFSPLALVVSIIIVIDSPGGVFFRQKRITQYKKEFYIFKFRTMFLNRENDLPVYANDVRITKAGKFLRKLKIDEIPQLFNVLLGNMTFVGTRPEIPKYVKKYSPEMFATLLLPAGITSEASVKFKNEEIYFKNKNECNDIYINKILPAKMKHNINYIKNCNFLLDLKIMIVTIFRIFCK
jgi:lipopolysaccharide/colanic/teichoic acid biosynthesis glycosyltransferase